MTDTPRAPLDANTIKSTTAGIGWWNVYFLVKILLFFRGDIDFHLLENTILLLYLLLPIQQPWLRAVRLLGGLLAAAWLLHYDSFLPPLGRLGSQASLLQDFELGYLFELLTRLLPLNALLGISGLVFGYFFLRSVFRITSINCLLFAVIAATQSLPSTPITADTTTPLAQQELLVPSDKALNNYLQEFHQRQSQHRVSFPPRYGDAAPFDIIFLSVCSLGWDDLALLDMRNHPFFDNFDIVFDQFNSATSYSGPAAIRLAKSSCGQYEHGKLYQTEDRDCQVFDNLRLLGYDDALLINHDGKFDDVLSKTRLYGGIKASMFPQQNIHVHQKNFSGSPVYSDLAMLSSWWRSRQQSGSPKTVALYNTVSLHDGNRIIDARKLRGQASYRHRAEVLFSDLQNFISLLEASDKNVVLVLIPEHGGALRGDKIQFSGMREIPSPSITHVPVAVKIIGSGIKALSPQLRIRQPSSHLALSQLLANILEEDIFAAGHYRNTSLAEGLPSTAAVSQNAGSTVVNFQGQNFVSLDGQSWSPYRSN